MNVWVIVALYWIVCCVLVYVLANINGQAAYRKMMKQKTTFWEHLLIVLFSPLAAPVMLFVLAYHSCINLYYRNRPRPLPKRMSGENGAFPPTRDGCIHSLSCYESTYKKCLREE